MYRLLLAAMLASIPLVSSPAAVSRPDPFITMRSPSGCSGGIFAFDGEYLYATTAQHCTGWGQSAVGRQVELTLWWDGRESERLDAEVYSVHPSEDSAVIRFRASQIPRLPYYLPLGDARDRPLQGEPVFAAGSFAAGRTPALRKMQVDDVTDGGYEIELSDSAWNGHSGGVVFNNRGRQIGNLWGTSYGESLVTAVPAVWDQLLGSGRPPDGRRRDAGTVRLASSQAVEKRLAADAKRTPDPRWKSLSRHEVDVYYEDDDDLEDWAKDVRESEYLQEHFRWKFRDWDTFRESDRFPYWYRMQFYRRHGDWSPVFYWEDGSGNARVQHEWPGDDRFLSMVTQTIDCPSCQPQRQQRSPGNPWQRYAFGGNGSKDGETSMKVEKLEGEVKQIKNLLEQQARAEERNKLRDEYEAKLEELRNELEKTRRRPVQTPRPPPAGEPSPDQARRQAPAQTPSYQRYAHRLPDRRREAPPADPTAWIRQWVQGTERVVELWDGMGHAMTEVHRATSRPSAAGDRDGSSSETPRETSEEPARERSPEDDAGPGRDRENRLLPATDSEIWAFVVFAAVVAGAIAAIRVFG